MSGQARSRRAHGFSLVEVLVAVLVISVGLLGVAKIQALAMSGTGTARMRSMVALAAASLAATMRADRAYWAGVANDPAVSVNVTSSAITASVPGLVVPPAAGCTLASPCAAPVQVAAQDLRDWASSLHTILPAGTNPTAKVNCLVPSGNPVTCAIQISWTESLIATPYSSNTGATVQQTSAALQQAEPTSYTLYAEP